MTVDELLVVEEIRRLKARYCYMLDLKDWDGYANLFTHDGSITTDTAVSTFGADPVRQPEVKGRETIRTFISKLLKDAYTVHQCHTPIIDVDSASSAQGIWAMEDVVRMPGFHLHARGHYRERYVIEDGVWRIKSLLLTRTMIDILEGTAAGPKM